MLELSRPQLEILSRLNSLGFAVVAFSMYANCVGIRRGDCAALLSPDHAGFRILGEPSWLVNGNLSVKIRDGDQQFFVWKKARVVATSEVLAALAEFANELRAALNSTQ